MRLWQCGREHSPPRQSACKYSGQNWLQGLSRRDLRHQIFCNWGSPATFFHVLHKSQNSQHFASAHSLSLWRVHVFISSWCPCPCSNSLNVWHKLLDWDSSCVFNWAHFNDLWNIKWPRWGWWEVSVPLSTELLLSFSQWNTNFHQHWPTLGQARCRAEMFPHFVLLLPPRPGIGLSDHRPPAGGNQVF